MEEKKTWEINKRKYSLGYQKDNYVSVVLHFNKKYEGKLIEWLNSKSNKTEYVKDLIEMDLAQKDGLIQITYIDKKLKAK